LTPSIKRKVFLAAGWFAAGSLALTALIGFAHTTAGRPLLAWLRGVPGCPLIQELEPREIEQRRAIAAARHAGAELAGARPALGFELGVTRRSEVEASFERRGLDCKTALRGSALNCRQSAHGDEPASDVYVQFDPEGRLVALDRFLEPRTAEEAVRLVQSTERALSGSVGAPTVTRGERRPEFLNGARFRQVSVEYRYADYVGRVAATNFGRRGLRVREQYQWLPLG
jgi:hypothetical protein